MNDRPDRHAAAAPRAEDRTPGPPANGRPHAPGRPSPGRVGLAACAALALALGCERDPGRELLAGAPGLTAELARALVSDEAAFAASCRRRSADELLDALVHIRAAYRTGSVAEYRRSAEVLDPPRRRLCRVLETQFGFAVLAARQAALMDLPAARIVEGLRIGRRTSTVARDSTLSPLAKIRRLEQSAAEIRSFGYPLDPSNVYAVIGDLLLVLGRFDDHVRYRRAALAEAQAAGNFRLACQMLGVLGEYHRQRGELDSLQLCWRTALELATRHRLAEQAGRLHTFFASYYVEQGRLALAHDLYRLAEETCVELGGEHLAIRFALARINFYAGLGCWDLVARGLRRAPVLLRSFQARSPGDEAPALGVQSMRARLALGRGEVAGAVARFEALDSRLGRLGERLAGYPLHLWHYGDGLLRHRRPREALEVGRRALDYCRRRHVPEWIPHHLVLAARAQADLGDWEGCATNLDAFAGEATRATQPIGREWAQYHALRVRHAAALRDREGTIRALRAGLAHLEALLGAGDAGPEADLERSARGELRDAIRGLVAADAPIGYWTEVQFRRAFALAGCPAGERARGATPLRELSAGLEAHLRGAPPGTGARAIRNLQDSLHRTRSLHCLYAVAGDSLIRWTVGPGTLRRETLQAGAGRVRDRVERVLAALSGDPGATEAPLDPAIGRDLRELARAILPVEVLDPAAAGAPEQLLVTPDGGLDLIPFETLDVGDKSYRPLLDRMDVVYYRPTPASTAPRSGAQRGVIFADPLCAPAVRRLHHGLPHLDAGRGEAALLGSLAPSALQLAGPGARKAALLGAWEDAPFLYFATHVVREAGSPFASFIPLGDAGGPHPSEADYLEVADIRAANLQRCGLVVLSGCASGRPYLGDGRAAPSLADAFLDAGAREVVQTAWPVRDDLAGRLMSEFVRRWAADGLPPAAALQAARRAHARGARGFHHPFAWGAFTITRGDLPTPALDARPDTAR